MILFALLLIGVAAWVVLRQQKGFNWWEIYRADSDQPYGSTVLHALLKENLGARFIEPEDSLARALREAPRGQVNTYFFVGETIYLDSTENAELIDFVKRGNTVFIASYQLENRFLDSLVRPGTRFDESIDLDHWEMDEEGNLHASTLIDYYLDTTITLELSSGSAACALDLRFKDEPIANRWAYFLPEITSYSGDRAEVLGTMDGEYPVFLSVAYGEGTIYLHSIPLAFTNYHLIRDSVMRYDREVLAVTGDGQFIWDEDNRFFDPNAFDKDHTPDIPDEGPLEFILGEPMLRRAWYLLLLAAFLYLFFGARRKQRIIPVKENMENTSIEYAEVISQLFMQQSDHSKLIRLKMDLFRAHLRDRYGIRLPLQMSDEGPALYAHIAQRSGVSEELVRTIFENYQYLSSIEGIDTPTMLAFHRRIEEFYATGR